jgi:hypothetical protein
VRVKRLFAEIGYFLSGGGYDNQSGILLDPEYSIAAALADKGPISSRKAFRLPAARGSETVPSFPEPSFRPMCDDATRHKLLFFHQAVPRT